MSNPYAPPEDRLRDAPEGGPAATGPGGPPATAGPADRSPEGVPYERPRGARQDPPARPQDMRRLAGLLRSAALLVLLAVVVDLLAFPWFLAGGLVAIAALAVGLTALTQAARTRQRGAQRGVIGLLLVVAVLSLARPGMALLTWDAESALARCQGSAITVQAQHACVSEYQQALDDRAAALRRPAP